MCHFFYLSFLLNNEIIFLWTLQEKLDLIKNKQCAPYYLKSSDGLFFPTLWLYSNLLSHKTIRNKLQNNYYTDLQDLDTVCCFLLALGWIKQKMFFSNPFGRMGELCTGYIYDLPESNLFVPICLAQAALPTYPSHLPLRCFSAQ